MSPRQWLALLGFYTAYLFFGASVFYYTEHGYETQQRAIELQKRIAINGKVVFGVRFKLRRVILRNKRKRSLLN